IHLESGAEPGLGLGIIQIPFIHLSDDIPVDPRVLGGRPFGPVGKGSAPVLHALLEDMAIKGPIVVDSQIQMFQYTVEIGPIHERNETQHDDTLEFSSGSTKAVNYRTPIIKADSTIARPRPGALTTTSGEALATRT